jgi:transcriptional regulator with XRE-family HTH domain
MNRIKDVLEQKGIKQKWLAEQLGKSYNMVNSYAQNRRQPSLEDLYKIAEILDIEVKELLIERNIQHKKVDNRQNDDLDVQSDL